MNRDISQGGFGTMNRLIRKIGVVGDDVTGSNDIGIMFGKSDLKVHIFSHTKVNDSYKPADVVIVDTDSRFDKPEVAYKKVYEATTFLKNKGVEHFYNKTCSVFRGNIGAEFDAMLDALNEEFGVVVLGFPKNGRVTRDGIHYVHGKLLEESEFRNDPMNPMRESNLVDILKKQTNRMVTGINSSHIDKGSEHLRDYINSLKGEYNYVILDVRSQEDLKVIAGAIYDFKVICGASAIAEEVALYYETSFADSMKLSIPDVSKGILVTAGSLMPQTRAQIEKCKYSGISVETLNTLMLFEEAQREEEIERLADVASKKILEGEDIVIHASNENEVVEATKEKGKALGMMEVETSKLVSKSLAVLAERIILNTNQHRVLVAGGDTSASFCENMGITGMQVYKEIQPGLPSCITLQEEPLLLILKSGSFGNEKFFIDAISHLKEY
jgi:uncharacterized protein YgbK (DUF1537 family)